VKPKARGPLGKAAGAGSGKAGQPDDHGEVLLYQTDDGRTRIEARLAGSTGEPPTVWLSLAQLAELFQRDKSVISRHIKHVFATGELDAAATVAVFATVQLERKRRVARNLEFAELQAKRRKPMYMAGWIAKLDDFLRLSDSEVLTHSGAVSHQEALAEASREYEQFHEGLKDLPSTVESDFEAAIKRLPAALSEPRKTKGR